MTGTIRRTIRTLIGGTALVATCLPAFAQNISGDAIKIGVMNDQSGPYADNCGPGSVAAARLAVQDHGGAIKSKKIEILVADDQNKPDIGLSVARKWLDEDGVDVIVGCSASSIALAVSDLMEQRKKPYILAGTASTALTNDKCSPMNTQWVQDIYALPKATVKSLLGQGLDTWFFITVDYSFGKDWQAETTRFLEQGGGKVIGSVLHPLNSPDFSSFLVRAQASKAKVVALANSGSDFSNVLKQAGEFGIAAGGQKMAPLGLFINATHGIGLETLQNISMTTPFYWDRNEETRAFAKRYGAAFNGRVPNEAQASTYSAVNHYLKAVASTGTDDGATVAKAMHDNPVDDATMKGVKIRADGQVMRPIYAARIKTPAQSKYPYDYYEITGTLSPEDVFRPASESSCKLLKTQ